MQHVFDALCNTLNDIENNVPVLINQLWCLSENLRNLMSKMFYFVFYLQNV